MSDHLPGFMLLRPKEDATGATMPTVHPATIKTDELGGKRLLGGHSHLHGEEWWQTGTQGGNTPAPAVRHLDPHWPSGIGEAADALEATTFPGWVVEGSGYYPPR